MRERISRSAGCSRWLPADARACAVLAVALLAAGCDLRVREYGKPVEISGLVLRQGSDLPIDGACVRLSWYHPSVLVDSMVVLAETVTDDEGRFSATLTRGPLTNLVARTPDRSYRGSLDDGYGWKRETLVVHVQPNLSILTGREWPGDPPGWDYARLFDIVRRMLSGHVPGTPPPQASLDAHLEAGRITEDDIAFLLAHRRRLSGTAGGDGEPPPDQARVLWQGEMTYGDRSEEVVFLSPRETRIRNGMSPEMADYLLTYFADSPDRCGS